MQSITVHRMFICVNHIVNSGKTSNYRCKLKVRIPLQIINIWMFCVRGFLLLLAQHSIRNTASFLGVKTVVMVISMGKN